MNKSEEEHQALRQALLKKLKTTKQRNKHFEMATDFHGYKTLHTIKKEFNLSSEDVVAIGFTKALSDQEMQEYNQYLVSLGPNIPTHVTPLRTMYYIPIPSNYNDSLSLFQISDDILEAYAREKNLSSYSNDIKDRDFYVWKKMPQNEKQAIIQENDFKYLSEHQYPVTPYAKKIERDESNKMIAKIEMLEFQLNVIPKKFKKEEKEQMRADLKNLREQTKDIPPSISRYKVNFFKRSCKNRVTDYIKYETKINYRPEIYLKENTGLTITFTNIVDAKNAMKLDVFKAMGNDCQQQGKAINIKDHGKIREFVRNDCGVDATKLYNEHDLDLDNIKKITSPTHK